MFDLNNFQKGLDGCHDHLITDFSQIHTGRATPELIEDIKVNAYGTVMTVKSCGTISVTDARALSISPWDKSLLDSIAKGVTSANLGFQAAVDGELVRVRIPELTEERRKEYVKIMKEKVEHARISVRNVRQDAMQEVEKLVENGMSEDEGKRFKEDIEKRVKAMNEKIAQTGEAKEAELMKV